MGVRPRKFVFWILVEYTTDQRVRDGEKRCLKMFENWTILYFAKKSQLEQTPKALKFIND